MLLIFFSAQAPPPPPVYPGVDVTALIAALLPQLNAAALTDLTWTSQVELLEYADEGAKRLARHAGVFVVFDSIQLVNGTATYPVPSGWIDSVHVSLTDDLGVTTRLRPSSIGQILALDASWMNTEGAVERYLHDTGAEIITVYRIPISDGVVNIFHHAYPADLTATQTLVPLPIPMADYLTYRMLARARDKQSEATMPEMAKHFRARADLYEKIAAQLWGEAE